MLKDRCSNMNTSTNKGKVMIFMEMRCQDSAEPWAEPDLGYKASKCWSYDNEGCGVFTLGTRAGANSGYKELVDGLRECGWVKQRHGWVCPHCIKSKKTYTEAL
jgi:hypothetical protein